MMKSFARIFHQLIALTFLALIILGALFALASLSNTTIADVFRLPVKGPAGLSGASQINNSSGQSETLPEPTENPVPKPKLSLGLVANTHTSEKLQSVLTTLQQANVDAILILGNATQTGSVDELRGIKEILDGIHLPTYFIPGINDLKTPFISSIFGFRPNSQMYQEIDLAGLKLLLIDNADSTVGIAPEQWSWLATTLTEENTDNPTLVFLHTRSHQDPTTQLQNAELDRLFASASPSAVIDASMVDGLAILDVFEDNTWRFLEIRN